jgi:hypothetical protein
VYDIADDSDFGGVCEISTDGFGPMFICLAM